MRSCNLNMCLFFSAVEFILAFKIELFPLAMREFGLPVIAVWIVAQISWEIGLDIYRCIVESKYTAKVMCNNAVMICHVKVMCKNAIMTCHATLTYQAYIGLHATC